MSHRMNLTLEDHAYDALIAVAKHRGCRPGTLAGELLTNALPNRSPDAEPPPLPNAHAAPEVEITAAPSADGRDDRALWLRLDRGPDWGSEMWQAVLQLRRSYPILGSILPHNWHRDRFTRDGIIALAVWRAELDTGQQNDPRLEHQWINALHDFYRHLENHRGTIRETITEIHEPDDW